MCDVGEHRMLANVALVLLHKTIGLESLNEPSVVIVVVVSAGRRARQLEIFGRPIRAESSRRHVLGNVRHVLEANFVLLHSNALSDV